MDSFTSSSFTAFEPPLTDYGPADALRDIARLPFPPGASSSRSLWLMFVYPWEILTRAVMPVDDSLGPPDPDNLASLCDVIAMCMEHSPPDVTALIALRRPGATGISDADEHIFRAMSQATASRDTPPWAFYAVGPDGVHEVSGGRL